MTEIRGNILFALAVLDGLKLRLFLKNYIIVHEYGKVILWLAFIYGICYKSYEVFLRAFKLKSFNLFILQASIY